MKPIYDISEQSRIEFEFTVVIQQLGPSQVSRISYTSSYEAPSKTTVHHPTSPANFSYIIYLLTASPDSVVNDTQPIGRMQKTIYDI